MARPHSLLAKSGQGARERNADDDARPRRPAGIPGRPREDIIPLIGTKRRDRLHAALGALDITLTPDEVTAIEAAVPPGQVAGDRYDAPQMAALDSETPS